VGGKLDAASGAAAEGPGQSSAAAAGPGQSGAARDGELAAAVWAAQRGDAEAFRVLYRDLQPRLLRYLGTLVGADAEDVASETWLQVARDLRGFAGDAGDFRGWVTTIARNRALDQIRRNGRRPESVPTTPERLVYLEGPAVGRADETADHTAAGAIEAVTTDAALRLIATLPPDQAEAVLLRAVVGLDAATAAAVVGKRPGAVRSAAHRGLRTLAKRLAENRGERERASRSPGRGVPVNNRDNEGVTPGLGLALKDMR
jgi:RNA polymerase sigma-70 factor (ECF subfamily)